VGRPSISHDPSLCYIAHPHGTNCKKQYTFYRGTKGANEGRYEIPSLLRKHLIWKREWFRIGEKFQRDPMPFRCHPSSFVVTKSEAVEKA
jgi:hypothetical protein